MSPQHLERLRPADTTYIYLTFDDGPYMGTSEVLDALEEAGIRATFFINSDKMFDKSLEDKYWSNREGQRNMIRIIQDGHTVGDHSYDHFFHNTAGKGIKPHESHAYHGLMPFNLFAGSNHVYQNKGDATSWFGDRNFQRVAELMDKSSLTQGQKDRTKDTFYSYIRMVTN
jgi:hypothetical protein